MTQNKTTKRPPKKPRKARGEKPLARVKIARILFNNAEYVLDQWLSGGELHGDEYDVCNPTRDDKSPGSFRINIKSGNWAEFAETDDCKDIKHEGGDLVGLFQYLQNEKCVMRELSEFIHKHGLKDRKKTVTRKKRATKKQKKPPTEPIKPEDLKTHPPDSDNDGNMVVGNPWEYRNADGAITHYVVRVEPEPGRKEYKPVRYVESQQRWVWSLPTGPLSLFNADMMKNGCSVLFGEGEKTAEHLGNFPDAVGITSCGGSGRILESDLSPLKNALTVHVFPDADEPGTKYAAQILAYCAIQEIKAKILNVQALGWSDGEDAADHPEKSMEAYEPHFMDISDWIALCNKNQLIFDTAFFQVAARMDVVEYDRKSKMMAKLMNIAKRTLDAKVKEHRPKNAPAHSDNEEDGGELTTEEKKAIRAKIYLKVKHIAEAPDILKLAQKTMRKMGVVQEADITNLTYLAVTSRLLRKPVNLLVKGSSSSGKSYTTQTTLKMFPEGAYHTLTGGSAKSLIYTQEDFSHKMLVILEATQLNKAGDDDPYSMFLRTLISEGYIRYETVEKNEVGELETRVIVKEGPTGLILTTTADHIHHENETRMLSAYPDESEAQTKAILNQIAKGYTKPVKSAALEKELKDWHNFHDWVSLGTHEAIIPFMPIVVKDILRTPVRFRRDINQLGSLIQTSTIIHQASRKTDSNGCLLATIDDYRIAREVIILSLQVATTETLNPRAAMILKHVYEKMPETVREGKEALKISTTKISGAVGIPQQTVSYQIGKMIESGYLKNVEMLPKKPMRLKLGEDFTPLLLSDTDAVLPTVEHLSGALANIGQPEKD